MVRCHKFSIDVLISFQVSFFNVIKKGPHNLQIICGSMKYKLTVHKKFFLNIFIETLFPFTSYYSQETSASFQ